MKIAIALLLGAVSSTNLSAEPSIWDEEIEAYGVYDACGDTASRWGHNSNSWNTYKSAYLGKSMYSDAWSGMGMLYSKSAPPQGNRASQYERGVVGFKRPKDLYPGEEVHLKGKLGEFAPAGIK